MNEILKYFAIALFLCSAVLVANALVSTIVYSEDEARAAILGKTAPTINFQDCYIASIKKENVLTENDITTKEILITGFLPFDINGKQDRRPVVFASKAKNELAIEKEFETACEQKKNEIQAENTIDKKTITIDYIQQYKGLFEKTYNTITQTWKNKTGAVKP